MKKIDDGQIKMRSKLFFIAGSIVTFVGLVSSIITSVFLVALLRFSIRSYGPVGEYRLGQIISNFPWWAPIIAVFSLFIGVKLLQRYEFSYKRNFGFIVFWFILAVLISGWIFDMTGLNEIWLKRGPMRGMMKSYFKETSEGQRVGKFINIKKVDMPRG